MKPRMNWSNVKLILAREVRDQLRDRRTVFMIVVLPLLLYPLLGMSFLQILHLMQEQPTSVLIVGYEETDDAPALLENDHFAPNLFRKPGKHRLLKLHFAGIEPDEEGVSVWAAARINTAEEAREAVLDGHYDAALFFPEDFAERLGHVRSLHAEWAQHAGDKADSKGVVRRPPVLPAVPQPEIFYTTANEKSQIAFARLFDVLRRWREEISRANLIVGGLPPTAVHPFEVETSDIARETGTSGIAAWAKILPVMLLIWALTGAFYPAIDLCAGEKERGTLETLLCSPAERSQIVCGKLLTVMLFSIVTAVLNILSVGLTGWLVLARMPGFGAPPPGAALWLLLALIPISALFSALCLALAAFARSSKEGQYYLMPLLLVTMPLVILPMAPSVELTLGTSLIPITNIVLLLRSLLEGHYWLAVQYSLPVVAVTLVCCLLAIRWAVDQFNQESVLFHESERLSMGLWLQHLRRDRMPTPSVGAAVFCGVLILVVKFFMSFSVAKPNDFGDLAEILIVTQLAVILTPALLMTILFTRRPMQTLLLGRDAWRPKLLLAVPAAFLLALAINPLANAAQLMIMRLYPIDPDVLALEGLFKEAPNLGIMLLLIAVLPGICEELAFRGFILSGFRHMGYKWRAIIWSSILFGFTHIILQQQLLAALVGVVIGFIAVQTGNLLPGIAFHVTHNSLALLISKITPEMYQRSAWLQSIMEPVDGSFAYRTSALVVAAMFSIILLFWFHQLPCRKSEEEELREAIKIGGEEPWENEEPDQTEADSLTDDQRKPITIAADN
ncbi:MAG: CPBP family intramembrane metalloprotease [Pirellulales bacterium]|nr:CPBP family intramembrane metalloprotease [Pirellulales bacterium]